MTRSVRKRPQEKNYGPHQTATELSFTQDLSLSLEPVREVTIFRAAGTFPNRVGAMADLCMGAFSGCGESNVTIGARAQHCCGIQGDRL